MNDDDKPPIKSASPDGNWDWLLELLFNRVTVVVIFGLILYVPALTISVGIAAFVGVVGFIMYMFHLSYPVNPSASDTAAIQEEDSEAVEPSSTAEDE